MTDDSASEPANNSDQNRSVTSSGNPNGAWKEWKNRWRDPITLFTLLLVVVGGLQYCTLEKTDDTLKLQQRAWLAPIGANLTKNPEKDGGIAFAVLFTNSGREPATGVKVQIKNSAIDSYDPKFTNMADINVPKNDTCDGLMPDPGRTVIPPTGIGIGFGVTENSIHGDPRFVADERIINGSKFYVVRGCAAYLTQNRVRYSSFCYILQSEMPAQPAQPASRIFGLTPCAAGFDAT
jgi:hypothetical protein